MARLLISLTMLVTLVMAKSSLKLQQGEAGERVFKNLTATCKDGADFCEDPADYPLQYLCTEAETVTWLRQPYLVTCYSSLLVYLVTCYLFYLSTCLLATCSTWIYMLLYPSFEVPLDCCCVERTVIQLLHSVAPPIPAVSVC